MPQFAGMLANYRQCQIQRLREFDGRIVGGTRRRRGLPSPLERDLDRLRLAGLDRVATVAGEGLEVLPELGSVVAAADRLGGGVDAAEGPALRAMAIRAVVAQALADLGDTPDARAARALFGGDGSSLRDREAAAATHVGRAPDTYRRRVRADLLPRLAEAVLGVELDADEAPAGRAAPAPALQRRRDQPRVEWMLTRAAESVFMCGINLDSTVSCVNLVTDIARRGVHVRLLSLDPRGRMLLPFSQFSGVDPEVRRSKISSNLRLIAAQIAPARGRIELRTVDAFMSMGCIGIDLHLPSGVLVVQHYLRSVTAEKAPTLWIERRSNPAWYDVYERALEQSWRESSLHTKAGQASARSRPTISATAAREPTPSLPNTRVM